VSFQPGGFLIEKEAPHQSHQNYIYSCMLIHQKKTTKNKNQRKKTILPSKKSIFIIFQTIIAAVATMIIRDKVVPVFSQRWLAYFINHSSPGPQVALNGYSIVMRVALTLASHSSSNIIMRWMHSVTANSQSRFFLYCDARKKVDFMVHIGSLLVLVLHGTKSTISCSLLVCFSFLSSTYLMLTGSPIGMLPVMGVVGSERPNDARESVCFCLRAH